MCRDDHVADAEGDIFEARPLKRHTPGEVRKPGDDGVVDEHVVLRQADVYRESRCRAGTLRSRDQLTPGWVFSREIRGSASVF
jgi:hypothetical protein